MNKVILKIASRKHSDIIIEADGVVLTPTRDASGRNNYTYDTPNSSVDIRIHTRENELLAHHWFLRYLFYYIISLFGLFDWAYSSYPYTIDYRATYAVEGETVLDFKWNRNEKSKPFESKNGRNDIIDNDTNISQYDARIKRRYVGAILFKVLSWVVLVGIIMLIVLM